MVMVIKNDKESGNFAAALMATVFVTGSGLIACVAIIFVFSNDPSRHLAIVGVSIVAFWVFFWLLRERPSVAIDEEKQFFWLTRQKMKEAAEKYEPKKKRRSDAEKREYGSNPPPNVKVIRDIKDQQNRWKPTDHVEGDYH